MLFPTIRFAIFFAVVMPVSWLLMPLPSRWRPDDDTQPWLAPVGLIAAAALLGPFAPTDGWPTAIRLLLFAAALVLAALAVIRLMDLQGLVRWEVFILLASYVFYGNYAWHFVALLAGSTVVNHVLTVGIHKREDEAGRRALLVLAVLANLAVLGWFKYKGFFIENSRSILEPLGLEFDPPAASVLPPVGISFFTFQALSYVIDTYRRRLEPTSLLDFAVYLSFFPHLVAGPIVRAAEFLPQLRTPRDARKVDTGLAFWLIAVGMFKKVVVSSYLAEQIVDPVFRIPSQHQAADTLLGIYGYAIQIYCDFSGYTDMAIGLALLLGFRFPQNFDAPYTSASLQEFWRRWHMTLSRWLRDYLYIPLGGNQRGPGRAYLNLFLTMVIGGFWHGAAWTFIIWGALHGGYLAAERWWTSRPKPGPGSPADVDPADMPVLVPTGSDPRGEHGADPELALGQTSVAEHDPVAMRPGMHPTVKLWLSRLLTFHVVCLGWVFFRATSVEEAFEVLGRLFHFGTGMGINLMVVVAIVTFIATQYVSDATVGKWQAGFSRLAAWQQGLLLAAWLCFTSALSPVGVAPFIYFAF